MQILFFTREEERRLHAKIMWKNIIFLLILWTTPSLHALTIRPEDISNPAILNKSRYYKSSRNDSKYHIGSGKMEYLIGTQNTSETVSTTCGGSLTSQWGRIEYKQFEAVAKNERCVWIVQPVGYTYAYVQLYSGNPAPDSGSLLVTSIATYGNSNGVLVTSVTPSSSSHTFEKANMLVITFTTSTVPSGRGFTPIFGFGGTDDGVVASENSLNVLASSDLGYIRHPMLQSSSYPSLDLSVFIVLPSDNCDLGQKIRLRYSEVQLENGDHDSLFLYEFQRPYWRFTGRIVSGVESQLVTSEDILMVVFASDSSREYGGFELVYAVC